MKSPQKLGSRYASRSYKIAIISFVAWLLWMWLADGINSSVLYFNGYNAHSLYKFDDWVKNQVGGLWPNAENFKNGSTALACLLTFFVLSNSPLFGQRIENSRRRFTSWIGYYLQRPYAQIARAIGHFLNRKKTEEEDRNSRVGRFEAWFAEKFNDNGFIMLLGCIFFFILYVSLGLALLAVMMGLSLLFLTILAILASWILYPLIFLILIWSELIWLIFAHFILEKEDMIDWSDYGGAFYKPLIFFIKYLIGSWLVLSGPFWLYKKLSKLGESSFFRKFFMIGRGASSRWAGPNTYDKTPSGWKKQTLFLGVTDIRDVGPEWGRPVHLDDDGHLLTIGCPGSGKSVTSIYPNLAYYDGPVIVLDPKGEHARETYWRRSSLHSWLDNPSGTKRNLHFSVDATRHQPEGNFCFKLDPFNEEPSIPSAVFNPLTEINIHDPNCAHRIGAIADGCVVSTGNEKSDFWNGNAKDVIKGFIALVLLEYPKENQNLPFIYDLIIEHDSEFGIADPSRLDEALDKMRTAQGSGGICQHAASIIGDRSGETFNGIISTVRLSLSWLADEALRKHIGGGSDFSFADFRTKENKTLYIVAPIGQRMEEQLRWLRVLTNLGITVMRDTKKPSETTLFILDEFPQLGSSLSAIRQGLTTLRSQKIKLWIFIQTIGQLRDSYGEKTTEFFDGSTVQVYGIQRGEGKTTAEWVSDKLGYFAHNNDLSDMDSRKLLAPSEVTEILGKHSPDQIIFPHDNGLPMRLYRQAHVEISKKGETFKSHPDMKGCLEER